MKKKPNKQQKLIAKRKTAKSQRRRTRLIKCKGNPVSHNGGPNAWDLINDFWIQ